MSDYQLSITPVKISGMSFLRNIRVLTDGLRRVEIPPEDTIISLGKALLDSTTSWKPGKTYQKVVKTFSRPKGPQDGAPWHCRVSEHTPQDATFDEFWSKLGVDKAENEQKYVVADDQYRRES